MKFEETQRFRQTWVWLIIIAGTLLPVIIFGYGTWQQLVQGKPFGTNPTSETTLVITFACVTVFCFLLLLLFGMVSLKVIIDETGVSYKFFPFHRRYRKISW